jgi:CDP-diacylglycerol--glycerol-3-phosphate 3-phosphatidyltransferase
MTTPCRRTGSDSIRSTVGRFGDIRSAYEVGGRRIARRIVRAILRGSHLSPNVVTVMGCLVNGIAAWCAWNEWWLAASLVFIAGSTLDALDGAVAKVTGKVSAFGAFLDSTLDRVSEGFMLLALGLVFARHDDQLALAACFVALASSYLVSYTRAKAEALGVQCTGGLASRFERVVLLAAGLALAHWFAVAIAIVVEVLAVVAAATVVQRVLHVRSALKQREQQRGPRRRRRRRRPPRSASVQAGRSRSQTEDPRLSTREDRSQPPQEDHPQ